jgi:3-phenylpropionate/cinnamic acid dioxygenase small subunit
MESLTLQEVTDRIAIDDLLTRYATAVDTKDWDLYASCFTSDAFIDYTSAGGIKGTLPEVKAWIARSMELFSMTQHLVTNCAVAITSDTATSRCGFFNPMGLPGDDGALVLFFDGGYYNDKLVRTPDGWRIAERVEETSYSTRLHRVLEKGEFSI